jgi:hypothetical protein
MKNKHVLLKDFIAQTIEDIVAGADKHSVKEITKISFNLSLLYAYENGNMVIKVKNNLNNKKERNIVHKIKFDIPLFLGDRMVSLRWDMGGQ